MTTNLDELMGREQVKPPRRDSRYEKWRGWLDSIDSEITAIYLNRDVWRGVSEIIRSNSDLPPSHFFDLMAVNYATSQAVAVRRQAEVCSRVVTLGQLLKEMSDSPEILSRQRYVSLFPWGMQHLGDKAFDDWSGQGGEHVRQEVIEHDLKALTDGCETIKWHVDKRIAHSERRAPGDSSFTFSDLDAAIDLLGDMFTRYMVLLTATDRTDIGPIPQYDWVAPFRVPWLPDESV